MSRAAPPSTKKRPAPLARNADRVNRIPITSSHRPSQSARSYQLRVRHRLLCGLLTPFRCSSCGELAFDPLGRNSKHEFLCGRCA
jgi:hypothetical protein